MATKSTISHQQESGPGVSCSLVLGIFLTSCIFILAYAIGDLIITAMGTSKYTSLGQQPEAVPFMVFISVLLSIITVTLLFPPSKINFWFSPVKTSAGQVPMPRYGLTTYALSCSGSLFIGLLLTGLLAFILIPLVVTNVKDLQALFAAIILMGPIEGISTILFTLFSIGFILTPPRANWIIRWAYKDFWDSRPY